MNQDFLTYESEKNFTHDEQQLIQEAKEATKLSYSPYSNFSVGAALLLEDGTVIKGANQENSSFPEGACAEKVTFFKAATEKKGMRILKVAVLAMQNNKLVPATPCGGCRQVMLEYEFLQDNNIELIMYGGESKWIKTKNIKVLLPFAFKL